MLKACLVRLYFKSWCPSAAGEAASGATRAASNGWSKSDMHANAVNLSKKPKTVDKIFRSTPISRALAGASEEEMARVSKLFDLAYIIAKESYLLPNTPHLLK